MVYPVRQYRKYTRQYAKPIRKRAKVYFPAAKQLARDVAYLGTLINSEPHYHITQTSNNFSYSGTVISLSAVPQGDSATARTGSRCLPRYLALNAFVSITTATTRTDPINCRAILFRYWGESTDAAPSVIPADVLATTGSQFAPLSFLNDNNTGPRGDRQRRIEIHKSWDFLLDKAGSNPGQMIEANVQVNGMDVQKKEHLQFRSASTEDPVSGGFYLLFISDDATATEVHYKVNAKLTFYDN